MTNLEQGTDACLWTPADVLTDMAETLAWEKARHTAQGAPEGARVRSALENTRGAVCLGSPGGGGLERAEKLNGDFIGRWA